VLRNQRSKLADGLNSSRKRPGKPLRQISSSLKGKKLQKRCSRSSRPFCKRKIQEAETTKKLLGLQEEANRKAQDLIQQERSQAKAALAQAELTAANAKLLQQERPQVNAALAPTGPTDAKTHDPAPSAKLKIIDLSGDALKAGPSINPRSKPASQHSVRTSLKLGRYLTE
jgi:hypothetical protein